MTDATHVETDPDKLKLFGFNVFSQLSGALTAGMIHLGDKLGLFGALAEAGDPLTTQQLADTVGLDERWIREWAHNQAAARVIEVDTSASPELFSLSPEAIVISPAGAIELTPWALVLDSWISTIMANGVARPVSVTGSSPVLRIII